VQANAVNSHNSPPKYPVTANVNSAIEAAAAVATSVDTLAIK